MKRTWTKEMDNLLRRHYPKGDLRALAARLGVSYGSVKSRASKLGIVRKVPAPTHVLTPEKKTSKKHKKE